LSSVLTNLRRSFIHFQQEFTLARNGYVALRASMITLCAGVFGSELLPQI
jgi:hypothetical protein